jgi:hypothetical protein
MNRPAAQPSLLGDNARRWRKLRATLTTHVSAPVCKKRGNGFSGSPNSLIGIAKGEPVLPSVPTKLVATGAHNLRDPGVPMLA